MKIGVYADRGNEVEIVVLAAEIVEIILNLGGEIFYQPEFDPGADGESGALIGEDLSCPSNTQPAGDRQISTSNQRNL